MDHAAVMNSCDAKAQRVGLSRLTAVERVVVLVSRANFEFEMGGLDTFYYNSEGKQALATVAALEAVCARHAVSALRTANALFPDGAPPTSRKKRFAALESVRALPRRPLERLEARINKDDPDIFSLLCSFIDSHASELRKHVAED